MNNAGVCRLGSFLDMSDDDRDFHIDINIKGVWNVTKAVLPEMIARKDGRIVMMSSVTGDMVADPGETAYALTKAAIVGLTKSLAVEYAQSGIRVNAICPGYVRTPMAESIARQSNPEDPESVLTEMAKAIPMRRLADPLEVGELAAQDINAPFFFLRAFDSCGYRRRVTHIGDNRRTAMTTTTQFVRQLFDLRGDIQQD